MYIGIDPTSGKRPIHYAVLDDRLRIVAQGEGRMEAVLEIAGSYDSAVCAVDAPQSPNGGLLAETWADFHHQTDISVVVNLRAGSPDVFGPPPPLASLWLPADDAEDLPFDAWLVTAQFVDSAVQLSRRVLLHCRLGLHRTRPLFAAYLIYTGKSVKAALREVEARPWMKPYRGNPARLEEFAARAQKTIGNQRATSGN